MKPYSEEEYVTHLLMSKLGDAFYEGLTLGLLLGACLGVGVGLGLGWIWGFR